MSRRIPKEESSLVTDHRRCWRDCRYVYPVLSRRAGGLSLGVNLNPDQRCNYRCVYCQVDRAGRRDTPPVDLERLGDELAFALAEAESGRIWNEERFSKAPAEWRRINDIAFSGDGEPTCLPNFAAAVAVAGRVLARDNRIDRVKLILITNASRLNTPEVRKALPILDAHAGEIWAKLDAGTEAFFRRVNRPAPGLSLDAICRNILSVAQQRPVVIQTLFFRWAGAATPAEEIAAYSHRLRELLIAGGRIKLIQLHTVARRPAMDFVSYLPEAQLQEIANEIRRALPEIPVETYPGVDVPPQ